MRKIEIYAINHDHPGRQPAVVGGISKEFVCGRDDRVSDGIPDLTTYADMRAPYWIWKNRDDLDIIGFHGYRKFLDFVAHLKHPKWYDISPTEFRQYQAWLASHDGGFIQELLAQYDIIVAPAFNCSYNIDMAEDFRRSRSSADWDVVEAELTTSGMHTSFIRPMHFVTRASVFQRYMEWWWFHAERIRSLIKSEDALNPAYISRPMAYISERMYSLWLDRSKLSFVEVPLLNCWGVK